MTQPAPIAPARDFDVMRTKAQLHPAFTSLANDPVFRNRETLRAQVLYAKDFFASEEFEHFAVTNPEIARFLGLHNDSVVSDIVRRGDNQHMQRGRIPTLTATELVEIQGWIVEAARRHEHLTLAQVVAKIEEKKHKTVTTNAVQKALTRNQLAKAIIATPRGGLKIVYAARGGRPLHD